MIKKTLLILMAEAGLTIAHAQLRQPSPADLGFERVPELDSPVQIKDDNGNIYTPQLATPDQKAEIRKAMHKFCLADQKAKVKLQRPDTMDTVEKAQDAVNDYQASLGAELDALALMRAVINDPTCRKLFGVVLQDAEARGILMGQMQLYINKRWPTEDLIKQEKEKQEKEKMAAQKDWSPADSGDKPVEAPKESP